MNNFPNYTQLDNFDANNANVTLVDDPYADLLFPLNGSEDEEEDFSNFNFLNLISSIVQLMLRVKKTVEPDKKYYFRGTFVPGWRDPVRRHVRQQIGHAVES